MHTLITMIDSCSSLSIEVYFDTIFIIERNR
jgi:hypothetical protein